MPAVRIQRATSVTARAQADWIVATQPWAGLGYRAAGLGRWLARMSRDGEVWLARAGARGPISGVVVVQDGVLLGGFVALIAVKAAEAGRGIGRALMAHVEQRVSSVSGRRWLYVSADGDNRDALRFYRKLDFARVGRLPDLIQPGRAEILLRKGLAKNPR